MDKNPVWQVLKNLSLFIQQVLNFLGFQKWMLFAHLFSIAHVNAECKHGWYEGNIQKENISFKKVRNYNRA